MPTVAREAGYDFQILTHDHDPPHVHVFARGCELIVNLNCGGDYVGVRENYGFKKPEIRDILWITQNRRGLLCEAWKEIHGELRTISGRNARRPNSRG